MTPERSHEIERLYHEARDRDSSERSAFLESACGGDEPLRAEVESLLVWREHASGFLEVSEPGAATSASTCAPPGFFRRHPWWVWCWSVPVLIATAAIYFVGLTGPVTAGWKLAVARADGRPAAYRVISITPGMPAQRAGFEVGDLISITDVERFARERSAGVSYRFEVLPAERRQTRVLTLPRKDWGYWRGSDGMRQLAVVVASFAHLALVLTLLFAAPRDRAARWGALLFAQLGFFLAGALIPAGSEPETAYVLRALPLPIGVLICIAKSLSATIPAGAFGFCAVFPNPLPLSNQRWWPWWIVPIALFATAPIDLNAVWLPVYAGPYRPEVPQNQGMPLGAIFVAWAMVLLARSYRRIERPNERRRLRLVVVGFAVTTSTVMVDILLMTLSGDVELTAYSAYWRFASVLLLSSAALCTTYAILRHRVFDIHVIVRLGLRYAAARGLLLSFVPAIILALAVDVLMHRNQAVRAIAAERGLVYLAFVGGAVALHVRRKAWMDALDRRFFRERYDAYWLLSGVADDVRRSESLDEAAQQVIARIDEALHPECASLMVAKPGDQSFRSAAWIGNRPPIVPAGARLVGVARVLGKPLENEQSGTGWLQEQLPRIEREFLRRARVEWLFPVSLRQTGTQAFLLLGPKRSEEPYSREDRHLLEALTASLGLLLDHTARVGFTECPTCGACYDLDSEYCLADRETLIGSPYPRTIAGRYRFERRLGRGGMGVVYEAFDTQLKRPVAVKVIRPDLTTSPDAVARFRREAKTAAGLSHPSVVAVHDFGVADDGRTYLVMELLKGRSLREALRVRRRFDAETTLEVLRAVSGAVGLAHSNGLVHRDLKPENIFLAQSDAGEVAKILDFGLVKPLNPGVTDTVAGTIAGVVIGTPAYMSPEQRRGDAPAEAWDVWALAVVAFEMLTGTHPFAFTVDARSELAMGGNAESSVDAPDLSPAASAFFNRALAVDCARRPASVRQFIDELETALAPS